MALRFLLDEHLRGPLWRSIQQHNAAGSHVLDVVRVGDLPDVPLGTSDPDLLLWCQANGRILISRDQTTMPGHLTDHFLAGHHIAGLLLLKSGWKITLVMNELLFYDQTVDPGDFIDRVEFIV